MSLRGYQMVRQRVNRPTNQRTNQMTASDPDYPDFGTCEYAYIGAMSAGCDAGCGWYDGECLRACEVAAAEQYPPHLFCRDPRAECRRQCNQDYSVYIYENCPEGCLDDPGHPECASCVADAENLLQGCLSGCNNPNIIGQGAYKARGLVHGSRYGRLSSRTSSRWPRQTVYGR